MVHYEKKIFKKSGNRLLSFVYLTLQHEVHQKNLATLNLSTLMAFFLCSGLQKLAFEV